jgi:hypothetical protein
MSPSELVFVVEHTNTLPLGAVLSIVKPFIGSADDRLDFLQIVRYGDLETFSKLLVRQYGLSFEAAIKIGIFLHKCMMNPLFLESLIDLMIEDGFSIGTRDKISLSQPADRSYWDSRLW